ncbi:uncharacterized protein LOC120657175 [Panicum virgatum]|uniref:Uncharacterized protein n=1 Tax=Panicum virgatum TaxID=38727 RepID=A0A8T0X5H2_PANVG|nr:uncharacterized protein LOC120657175 [Panicum virgatum]KAG2653858.1 hypothetical protein PVAP13_1NG415900 [Panicum virgatum]
MGRHGSSSGDAFPVCSRSPPELSDSPPLSKPGTAMSPGGGRRVGGNSNPPSQGVHPRYYVPKRGAVLKGIVRGVLRCFLLAFSASADSGGRRVRPAPAEAGAGDGGAEQGK